MNDRVRFRFSVPQVGTLDLTVGEARLLRAELDRALDEHTDKLRDQLGISRYLASDNAYHLRGTRLLEAKD